MDDCARHVVRFEELQVRGIWISLVGALNRKRSCRMGSSKFGSNTRAQRRVFVHIICVYEVYM